MFVLDIIYIGYTSDLIDRFHSHNQFATKGYTVKFRPWQVIYIEFFPSSFALILSCNHPAIIHGFHPEPVQHFPGFPCAEFRLRKSQSVLRRRLQQKNKSKQSNRLVWKAVFVSS